MQSIMIYINYYYVNNIQRRISNGLLGVFPVFDGQERKVHVEVLLKAECS